MHGSLAHGRDVAAPGAGVAVALHLQDLVPGVVVGSVIGQDSAAPDVEEEEEVLDHVPHHEEEDGDEEDAEQWSVKGLDMHRGKLVKWEERESYRAQARVSMSRIGSSKIMYLINY